MTRVTIITDNDDVYEVEDEGITVDRSPVYTNHVVFDGPDVYPDDVQGLPPSTVRGWDIVVTDEEGTMSGSIHGAEAMRIRFRVDIP